MIRCRLLHEDLADTFAEVSIRFAWNFYGTFVIWSAYERVKGGKNINLVNEMDPRNVVRGVAVATGTVVNV